jgi:predicted DNA-binding transcriptional regulator AlpA
MTNERILRRPEVLRLLGVASSTLDRRIRLGDFPRPIKLGTDPTTRAVGWKASVVNDYLTKLGGAS